MPTINNKVKSLQKKICGAIKKEFEFFDRGKNTKKAIKTKEKAISCLFTTNSLSCREDHLKNFYFTRRENQIVLTCVDSQDNSHILKRSTFYGSFVVSPSIKRDQVFYLAESNESFSRKALINFSSLSRKPNRTKSMESISRSGSGETRAKSHSTYSVQTSPCSNKVYSKVIPFDDGMGEIYTRRDLDSKALLNWLNIQAWYLTYLEDKLIETDMLEKSKSDTALDDLALHCPNEYRSCKRDMKISFENVEDHKRFGTCNEDYLKIASKYGCDTSDSGNSAVEFYIKIGSNPTTSMGLCHLKTEMLVKCLKTFFNPYIDTTVMWVVNLDQVWDRIASNKICDVFHREVFNRDSLQAILFLMEEPAKLLRHKDLGFLDTLAVTLGLRKEDITILPM